MDNNDVTPELSKWRAVDINVDLTGLSKLKGLWGADIWINGWPVLKLLILANVVVWILMLVN